VTRVVTLQSLLARLLVLACAGAHVGHAQASIARSQLATVSQQVGGTSIEVRYRRPVARGRVLFGTLVPWGHIWTPSADSAARITISSPITVNGASLAAGTYSIWSIPDSLSWTIVFNAAGAAFHKSYPEGRDVLRVRATPQRGDHVESLMFSFPLVDADSAVMTVRWGTTIVPLTIRSVEPSQPAGP
jgi:hypothetical protein